MRKETPILRDIAVPEAAKRTGDVFFIEEEGRTIGVLNDLRIGSHFQPIFSLSHQRVVGFEALMRAQSPDGPRDPAQVFGQLPTEDAIQLDRLCGSVHLRNFRRFELNNAWLFLNVSSHVVAEGDYAASSFELELEQTGMAPQAIVVEILEAAAVSDQALEQTVAHYRRLGCLIAIDDFGAGHSNFDRIGRLRPDIVKLDRSIVTQAAGDRGIRALVPGMVSLLHEAGSLVVMEGIETDREAMIAMDADTDFVQGFYFARPQADISLSGRPEFNGLFQAFKQMTSASAARYKADIAPYLNGLGYASVLIQAGHPLDSACRGFLELPRSERCFVLDANGLQLGGNINAGDPAIAPDHRFKPLWNASGANWSRRHYFRRAIARPGKVHVTRPYLSAATATACVTASVAFKVGGERRVLCGDIRWEHDDQI